MRQVPITDVKAFWNLGRALRPLVAALVCAAGVLSAAHAAPSVAPDVLQVQASNGFDLPSKTRRAASGIACTKPAQERLCLVVFDEGTEARYARVQGDAWLPQKDRVVLLKTQDKVENSSKDKKKNIELDAEAAASDGKYYYVVGSHSVKRNSCAINPESHHVIRFLIDTASGRALAEANTGASGDLVGYTASNRLEQVMRSLPDLNAHLDKCLGSEPPEKNLGMKGEQGVNIEGLAASDGRLYFGFRGPSVQGEAPVLSIEAEPFFGSGDTGPVLTWLQIGKQHGIRDLTHVEGGLLMLIGPDDDTPKGKGEWSIAFWNGRGEARHAVPKLLAVLDLTKVDPALGDCEKSKKNEPAEVKPEALTVLDESVSHYKVLVLSDGLCDGGPLIFSVPH